ncbi:MAG: ABC transporter permease [Acidobacteria bacterium]|nr:MAG: ABC transporter permease [Acidobacteriota bacterium]
MDTLLNDLRFTLRTWRKRPLVTVAAILCIALGIGAATVVFSLVDAVVLRPLPYRDPDRIFLVWNRFPNQGMPRSPASGVELGDYQEQNRSFSHLIGFIPWYFNLTEGDYPERLVAARVSYDTFQMLGVEAALGRTFSAEEEGRGEPVAVLSHALWQRRFGGDPGIVGRTISLDQRPCTVIGVMPEDFTFLIENVELWVPLVVNPRIPRQLRGVQVVGRLADGVTPEQAQADLDAIAARLQQEYPTIYPESSGWGLELMPIHEQLVGDVRPHLLALLAAVLLVLLIACANVANLLLAQAASRDKEITIRAALGAGRRRLIRQLLSESVLLAVAGAALGLLVAHWGLRAVVALQLGNIPRLAQAAIDGRVLLFTLLVAVATGILFGLAPALAGTRRDLASTLKEGGRTSAGGGRGMLRAALVAGEIAVALVVLIAAGLMIRSFQRLQQVDPGFRSSGVLTVQLNLPRNAYPQRHQRLALAQRLVEEVRQLPEVERAGIISHVPLGPLDLRGEIEIERTRHDPGAVNPKVSWRMVDPGYFETMGIAIKEGRLFDAQDHDGEGAAQVVVIDERLAARLWPNESAIDKQLRLIGSQDGDGWRRVVGVVASVRQTDLKAAEEQLYVPFAQYPLLQLGLVIQTRTADPRAVVPRLRQVVAGLDPTLPLASVRTIDELIDGSLSRARFNRLLYALFGGAALLLAAIGVYGLMAHAVAQRKRELGLRLALGARPRDVLGLVVAGALRLTAAGLVAGVVAALVLVRALQETLAGMVHGITITDLPTFVGVPLMLALLALAASLLPAARASRVDPVEVLRYE